MITVLIKLTFCPGWKVTYLTKIINSLMMKSRLFSLETPLPIWKEFSIFLFLSIKKSNLWNFSSSWLITFHQKRNLIMTKFANSLKNFLLKLLTSTFNISKITSTSLNSKKCSLFSFNPTATIRFSIKPKFFKNILNFSLNSTFGKILQESIMEILLKKLHLHQINIFSIFLKPIHPNLKKRNLSQLIPNYVKLDLKHPIPLRLQKIWII